MRTSQIVCSGFEISGSVRGTVECMPCVYMYVCVCGGGGGGCARACVGAYVIFNSCTLNLYVNLFVHFKMYVCVCVCVCVCVYARAYVRVSASECVCICVSVCDEVVNRSKSDKQ